MVLSIYQNFNPSSKITLNPEELKERLERFLINKSVDGLPLRTRSKIVKEWVCHALDCQIPKSFKKTQPRFPIQNLDIYIQKSNNLQIWNEEITSQRRYAIIKLNSFNIIKNIIVLNGKQLTSYDKTGVLTRKFQARMPAKLITKLISDCDTHNLIPKNISGSLKNNYPTDQPSNETLIPITNLFPKLKQLLGTEFKDAGRDQEPLRGSILHKMCCNALAYSKYSDRRFFPDIVHQLLEIKLQTSPTIDLGKNCPDSCERIPITIDGKSLTPSDVRYAIFHGKISNDIIILDYIYLTTGKDFFSEFQQFEGKFVNKKLQIILPNELFN